MDIVKEYYYKINEIMQAVINQERVNIEKAALLVAQKVLNDKLFYVFGTGAHSIMPTMEVFKRAGGLCNVQGIFPPGLTDFDGSPKTERVNNFASEIFAWYGVEKNDLLLICNVNGINPMTIDAALEAKKMGIKTVGITSIEFAENAEQKIPHRHPSNKNLHELVDLVINAHVPVGDALLDIPGVPVKVGAGSTYPMILIVNSIIVRAISIVVEKGGEPPVLLSGNTAKGEPYNQKYYEKYRMRIRHF